MCQRQFWCFGAKARMVQELQSVFVKFCESVYGGTFFGGSR